MRKKLYEAAG